MKQFAIVRGKLAFFCSRETGAGVRDTHSGSEGVAKEQFEKWLDIENDVLEHAQLTLEEEETELMQEIVTNSSASGPEVAELKEAENDEAAAEEPTPSNAEMRSILHRLRIGLERRGFKQMPTFEAFDDNVRSLLRQTPPNQMTLDAFF